MRKPNTTFDLYHAGALATAGATGWLQGAFWRGQESSEGGARYWYTNVLEAPLSLDIRDEWPNPPGGAFYIAVPDATQLAAGQEPELFLIIEVERERGFRGQDFQRVFLQRVTPGAFAMEIKEADGNPDYFSVTVLVIDQATGLTLTQPAAGQAELHYDSKLLCSATDTTRDYLENKLSPGTLIGITLQNAGGDEDLLIRFTGQNWVRQRVLWNAW